MGLQCSTQAFSSYDAQGLLFAAVAQAFHCGAFSLVVDNALSYLPCGMIPLFRPGIKPVTPLLASGFFTPEYPGKSLLNLFKSTLCF